VTNYLYGEAPETDNLIFLFEAADQSLVKQILSNEHKVLRSLLPEKNDLAYRLRLCCHNRQLIQKSALCQRLVIYD